MYPKVSMQNLIYLFLYLHVSHHKKYRIVLKPPQKNQTNKQKNPSEQPPTPKNHNKTKTNQPTKKKQSKKTHTKPTNQYFLISQNEY